YGRCEAERRFVDHQQLRSRDESARKREHLLLAAAQGPSLLVTTLVHPGEITDDPPGLLLQGAPLAADVCAYSQVLPDGQLGKEAAALGHMRDAPPGDGVRGV